MIERIHELANQANADVWQLFAEMLCNDDEVNVKIAEAWNAQPDNVRIRIFAVIEQNQQKFAELIVQRCIDILMKPSSFMERDEGLLDELSEYNQGWVNGRLLGIEHIKEHFRIE